jgi:RNA polymerase sigma-70 factor, ECF subfamily
VTMTHQDDQQLIEEVLNGSLDGFAKLMGRYQDKLDAMLSYYCHSREEIEDLTQETFIKCYQSLDSFDRSRPFFPWLKTIALNGLRMELRRKQRETRRLEALCHERRIDMAETGVSEDSDERFAALRRCLQDMPKQQKQLVEARYGQNLPIVELARKRGCTTEALAMFLMRLRRALRDCIEQRLRVRR